MPLGVKSLHTQQDHRRAAVSGHRQMCVEIVVQRDTHSFVNASFFHNLDVLSPLHSDFGDMYGVQPVTPKNRRRVRSESLVQQNPLHATRSTFNRSSSTVAAA